MGILSISILKESIPSSTNKDIFIIFQMNDILRSLHTNIILSPPLLSLFSLSQYLSKTIPTMILFLLLSSMISLPTTPYLYYILQSVLYIIYSNE